MIIVHGKKIINFENVREVYMMEDGKEYSIKFFFDSADATVISYKSQEECIEMWNEIINAIDQKFNRCML